MKQAFQAYPEILFVDAMYKLQELGLPTYLFLSEDSNGQSEITGVCLLTSEDVDSMKWMIEVTRVAFILSQQVRIIHCHNVCWRMVLASVLKQIIQTVVLVG